MNERVVKEAFSDKEQKQYISYFMVEIIKFRSIY